MIDEQPDNSDNERVLREAIQHRKREAASSFAAPAASSQYLARWLPEDGGKAVIVGDWHEVLTAATLFMEMGANKIEIETVREMQSNDQALPQGGAKETDE